MVSTSNGWSFGYDANGNMNSYRGNSITWTSYNLPSTINGAGQSSQFWYGPNRNRWKQVASYPSGTETTIYVGGVLEKVTVASGTAYRHYLGAGSAQVIYTRWSTGSENTKYLTADHLNSSSVLMDSSGNTLVGMSFAAYGARRGGAWTGAPSSGDWSQINNATRHGYTGHEHLDNVNLIHMNGRVFEPALGRFLSADPMIDGIGTSQGTNRFGYVHGRPLNLVDPSGFCGRDVSESEWNTEEVQTYISLCEAHYESGGWGSIRENERWCAALDFGCQQAVIQQQMAERKYIRGIYRGMRDGGLRPLPKGKVSIPESDLCQLTAETSAKECLGKLTASGQNVATGQAASLAITNAAAGASRSTNPYGWAQLGDEEIKITRRIGTELLRRLGQVNIVLEGAELITMDGEGGARLFRVIDLGIESAAVVMFGPVGGTLAGAAWRESGGSRSFYNTLLDAHIQNQMFCERIGRLNCYFGD